LTDLPNADTATHAYFMAWLDTFAGYVREVDYRSARPLFHPDILAFGTHRDVIPGIEAWIATQWDNVWPRTADFRFDLAGTHVLASPDMAVVIAPWSSTGFGQDGAPFDRPGRRWLDLRALPHVAEPWRAADQSRRPAGQSPLDRRDRGLAPQQVAERAGRRLQLPRGAVLQDASILHHHDPVEP
jgi:ketosteroid isomerase-like protein